MDLLKTRGKWDSYKLGDWLAEYGKLSILEIPKRQVGELQFSIHPLVCEWMKLRKNPTEQRELVKEAIEILAAYTFEISHVRQPSRILRDFVSHFIHCEVNHMDLNQGVPSDRYFELFEFLNQCQMHCDAKSRPPSMPSPLGARTQTNGELDPRLLRFRVRSITEP